MTAVNQIINKQFKEGIFTAYYNYNKFLDEYIIYFRQQKSNDFEKRNKNI